MQLTESERQIIEKAKKSSVRWKKSRWIALLLLIVIMALPIAYVFMPMECIGYMLAGYAGYLVLRQVVCVLTIWNGVPIQELLLKLAEENNREN